MTTVMHQELHDKEDMYEHHGNHSPQQQNEQVSQHPNHNNIKQRYHSKYLLFLFPFSFCPDTPLQTPLQTFSSSLFHTNSIKMDPV